MIRNKYLKQIRLREDKEMDLYEEIERKGKRDFSWSIVSCDWGYNKENLSN